MLGFPRTQRSKDLVFVIVDRVLKMAHFNAYANINDVTQVSKLYCKEVMMLNGIPRSIMSIRGTKFFSYFCITVWKKMGT